MPEYALVINEEVKRVIVADQTFILINPPIEGEWVFCDKKTGVGHTYDGTKFLDFKETEERNRDI